MVQIMKRTNIKEQLSRHRNKSTSGEALLQDIKKVIAEDDAQEKEIRAELTYGRGDDLNTSSNNFNLDLLETDRIYHDGQIKHISTIYRLRFLDSQYFKKDLPYQAVQKTKALQKEHRTKLSGFKILAPAKTFRLKSADDPLLFAPIGNGYYYLIHKWGRDLSPWRKIFVWPWRNLECMIAFLFALSILLTVIFPKEIFTPELTGPQFFMIVMFMFKWVGGMAIFFLFKKGKNFSPTVWRSIYFN